ncbi:MAG: type II toxin-antitoxin system RelE/ParE family toxin [Spirulina sp. SIO3F2]|nr:type II toxin-antitoxin system RelE/ParE family toxin [Spirulina sp. SIO3F2]
MRYIFHPEALQEYSDAVRYYAERDSGLAQSFINAVEDAVFRLRETPKRYPSTVDHVRRCRVKKFPHSIVYSVEPDYILILAVMHGKQRPGYWKSRQKG